MYLTWRDAVYPHIAILYMWPHNEDRPSMPRNIPSRTDSTFARLRAQLRARQWPSQPLPAPAESRVALHRSATLTLGISVGSWWRLLSREREYSRLGELWPQHRPPRRRHRSRVAAEYCGALLLR